MAIEEFLLIRQAEGKSPGHLHDLLSARSFRVTAKGWPLRSPQTTRQAGLPGLAVAPQTGQLSRGDSQLFLFCAVRGYAPSNPVSQASKAKVPPKGIGILNPGGHERCSPVVREILPAVAIGVFAGLSREEIARLDWR